MPMLMAMLHALMVMALVLMWMGSSGVPAAHS